MRSGPVRVEEAIGPQVGFLDQILGVPAVARQVERQVEQRLEVREGDLLELFLPLVWRSVGHRHLRLAPPRHVPP